MSEEKPRLKYSDVFKLPDFSGLKDGDILSLCDNPVEGDGSDWGEDTYSGPMDEVIICHACGVRWGRVNDGHVATFHEGDPCGWCGRKDIPVTEPRDYGYPPSTRSKKC